MQCPYYPFHPLTFLVLVREIRDEKVSGGQRVQCDCILYFLNPFCPIFVILYRGRNQVPGDISDKELAIRAQRGDVSAVGQLYDRHHKRIYRYVWARVRNAQQAEDLTGEVFTRMVTGLSGYRPQSVPFQAWLYRIAHNLTVDHHRKIDRRELIPLYHAEGLNEQHDNPSLVVERQLTVERVLDALNDLDPAKRQVIELRFLAGLSLREVAQTLGKTVAAVKSMQHRGLTTLRTALKDG